MQPNKVSLVSLLAAAVMFLLPWVEFQCQGKSLLKQSGFDAAVGRASPGDEFKNMPQAPNAGKSDQSAGMGLFVLGSAVVLALGLLAAWRQVREETNDPAPAGRYAALALGLVCLQMAIGFPIERQIKDEMKKGAPGGNEDPFSRVLAQQVAGGFQTKYLPALYLYLAALGVPVVIWLTGSGVRARRDGEPASFSK